MCRHYLLSIVAVLACTPLGLANDTLFSGPQVGEKLPAFQVTGVRGDLAGKDVDLVATAQGKPIVLAFFGDGLSRPAFQLMRSLTRHYTAKKPQDQLTTGLIFLTDDPTEKLKWATQVQRYFPESAVMGISKDGHEGPGAYGLNRNVTLTVLVGTQGKVTGNFAMGQPSLAQDGPKILAAIAKVLGEKPPSLDEILAEERAERAKMRANNPRMRAREQAGKPKDADRAQQDPELSVLLRRVINRQASESQVTKAVKELEKYVEGNELAKQDLAKRAVTIAKSGKIANYGTKPAQAAIQAWAKKYGDLVKPKRPAAEKK